MTQQLLSELERVKVLFQARTIALHLGAKPPETLQTQEGIMKTTNPFIASVSDQSGEMVALEPYPQQTEGLTAEQRIIHDALDDLYYGKSDGEHLEVCYDAVSNFIKAHPDEPAPSPASADHIAGVGKMISPSPTKPEGLDREHQIATLYDAIKHGDDEHKAWLKAKVDEHFALSPVSDASDTVRVKRDIIFSLIASEMHPLHTIGGDGSPPSFVMVGREQFDRLRACVNIDDGALEDEANRLFRDAELNGLNGGADV